MIGKSTTPPTPPERDAGRVGVSVKSGINPDLVPLMIVGRVNPDTLDLFTGRSHDRTEVRLDHDGIILHAPPSSIVVPVADPGDAGRIFKLFE